MLSLSTAYCLLPSAAADVLSVDLLKEELETLTKKWYEFGQALGLTSTQLHTIEHETGQDAEYYFSEVLTTLLDEGSEVKMSWGRVVDGVRMVGDGELASRLAEKYGKRESMEESISSYIHVHVPVDGTCMCGLHGP